VLIDTTVWIDWLRGQASATTDRLTRLLDEGDAVMAPVILQELLHGARSPQALTTLRASFSDLPMLIADVDTYADAGALYARCRWKGYTPRSPHDCLIAQLAIDNRLLLLHDDRDFEFIARIEPKLLCWRHSEE